jgi:hypothetical protein
MRAHQYTFYLNILAQIRVREGQGAEGKSNRRSSFRLSIDKRTWPGSERGKELRDVLYY